MCIEGKKITKFYFFFLKKNKQLKLHKSIYLIHIERNRNLSLVLILKAIKMKKDKKNKVNKIKVKHV